MYVAEQTEPVHRRVALKIIKLGMDTREVIARFEAERQALAMMDHPNIAKVLDAGTTEAGKSEIKNQKSEIPAGRPYFVMELVRGIRITDYCDQTNLSTEERLELFIQVCHAVQHAHQKGIIHRDLKPSNILVTLHDGVAVPKVIDFGIAKATTNQRLTDKTLFTAFEQFMGTPAYMSPEQAEMSGLDVDTRSDIYSLGVLLYELLTGRTPFDARKLLEEGLEAMRRTIRETEPARPSTRLKTLVEADLTTVARQRQSEPLRLIKLLSGDVDWIVMKALEKDRSRRYETANSMALDLQHYLNDEPVLARPPSRAYRVKKFVRKHRGPVTAAAGLVLLLTAATAVSIGLALWANREKTRAGEAQQLAEAQTARAVNAEADANQSAREARESEAEARKVLGFFQDRVLAAARPQGQEGGLGRDATIRAAVNAAEPAIQASFTNQPRVEASIRNALGQTYYLLGEYPSAIRQFERSLALYETALDPAAPESLNAMNNLALAYLAVDRVAEAVTLVEKVCELGHGLLDGFSALALRHLGNLGRVYLETGQLDQALNVLDRVVGLSKLELGPDDPTTLMAMHNLASAYHGLGRFAEALPLYEETLERTKATLGPDHPETLMSMNHLALTQQAIGRPEIALPLLQQAVDLGTAKLGRDHPDTLVWLHNLALAYHDQGELTNAIPLYEEALELREAKLGLDHPSTIQSMNDLAAAYYEANRVAEALPLIERAMAMTRDRLGVSDPETLQRMDGLAVVYFATGRFTDALSLSQEVLRLREDLLGPTHPETLKSLFELGVMYSEGTKDFASAEPLLLKAYEGLRRQRVESPSALRIPPLEQVGERIARLYEDWGKPQQAAEWRQKLTPSTNAPPGLSK